jgi:hypothetical protein
MRARRRMHRALLRRHDDVVDGCTPIERSHGIERQGRKLNAVPSAQASPMASAADPASTGTAIRPLPIMPKAKMRDVNSPAIGRGPGGTYVTVPGAAYDDAGLRETMDGRCDPREPQT